MTTITNQKLHEIVRQIEAEWDQVGLSGEGNLYADLAVLTAQRAIALAQIDADERYVAGAVDARGAMAQIWEDALNDASWPEEITKIPEVRALFERTKSRKKDWVLIAADAYEAGFGKGQQAAARGIEIENPWSDEPGREAWALGYGTGKGRYRPRAEATPTDDYAAESDTAELAANSALPRPLMLAQRLEKTAQWPLHLAAADELRRMHAQAAVEQGLLPERETTAMHDAVMAVIYSGVTRGNTDALWQAYRRVLLAAAPESPAHAEDCFCGSLLPCPDHGTPVRLLKPVAAAPAQAVVQVPQEARDGINGEWNACMFRDHCRSLLAAPEAPATAAVSSAVLEAMRHSANEWADMATNGLQWLRNIVDGISAPADALKSMEANLLHCRKVNDSPMVQAAVRSERAPEAPATAVSAWACWPDGQPLTAENMQLSKDEPTAYPSRVRLAPEAPAPAVVQVPQGEYQRNVMSSLANWLETRSHTIWAQEGGHDGLMQIYAADLRAMLATPEAPAQAGWCAGCTPDDCSGCGGDPTPSSDGIATPEAPAEQVPLSCNKVPPGNGYCDKCAKGLYEQCRYTTPLDAAAEAPAQTYICTETMHTEIPCPKCKPLPALPAEVREALKVAREALAAAEEGLAVGYGLTRVKVQAAIERIDALEATKEQP